MLTTITRRSLLAMAGATAGLTGLVATPATAAPITAQTDLAEFDAAGTAPVAPAAEAWTQGDVAVQALRNGVCDNGEFCAYLNSARSGPVIDWAKGVDDLHYGNDTFPGTSIRVGDEVSSVWNRTGCIVTVYRDGSHGGAGVAISPTHWSNMSGTPVGNDEASSHDAHHCP